MRNAKVIESEIEALQKQIADKQKELDETKIYSEMADKIIPIILKWKEKEDIPLNKVIPKLKDTLRLTVKKEDKKLKLVIEKPKPSKIKTSDKFKQKLLSLKNIPQKDIPGITEAITKATSDMDVDVYLRVALGKETADKYLDIIKANFKELKPYCKNQ